MKLRSDRPTLGGGAFAPASRFVPRKVRPRPDEGPVGHRRFRLRGREARSYEFTDSLRGNSRFFVYIRRVFDYFGHETPLSFVSARGVPSRNDVLLKRSVFSEDAKVRHPGHRGLGLDGAERGGLAGPPQAPR